MWLLSTDRAELHHFVSPDAIEEGYTILSHVWDAQEQSFKDIRKLQKKCVLTGENPRQACCEVAEQYGYKWVWIDSCCIDKTSSAELSEAINSMFRYYSLSQVCFVYMADVTISRLPSSFYESRWHTRGWTLQELIAPPTSYFLYSDWTLLGTKFGVADAIEEITRVPSSLLLGYTRLSDYSVAQRMSWAASRRTTRVEDEAYCLFGLLDVNMPTLYGEGGGQPIPIDMLLGAATTTTATSGLSGWPGLFAPSPSAFIRSGSITYSGRHHMIEHASRIHMEAERVRSFSVTPHGVLSHIPVVEHNGLLIADLCWSDGDHNALALVLRRLPQTTAEPHGSALCGRRRGLPTAARRAMSRPAFDHMAWVWRDVYIMKGGATSARIPILEDCGSFIPFSHVLPSPIRFPEAAIDSFGAAFDTSGLSRATSSNSESASWEFQHHGTSLRHDPHFLLVSRPYLGRCWANVRFMEQRQAVPCPAPDHACPHDHIVTWWDLKGRFVARPVDPAASPVFSRKVLVLSFELCPINPDGSFVLKELPRRLEVPLDVQNEYFKPEPIFDGTLESTLAVRSALFEPS
ncbi:heterokaryon incompatibility protein-domain-containing protein [Cerioporus squamosus]|nr:heterokaryon incompatibility protein-domain-containing protein [Cerioporus squamosus]